MFVCTRNMLLSHEVTTGSSDVRLMDRDWNAMSMGWSPADGATSLGLAALFAPAALEREIHEIEPSGHGSDDDACNNERALM